MWRIGKILVPIDFSEHSRQAMHDALDLAARLGAEVTLLHVYVLPTQGDVVLTAGAHAELMHAADTLMASALAEARSWTVPVESLTEHGPVAETIARVAGDGLYDLVVIGTHGRTGLKRFLLGSVAERVLRHSPAPVLTVREASAGEAHPVQ
jgi:nucleotide-binding universal stress UspA family protein